MKAGDLKSAIALKTIEFETALATEKPNTELIRIYKELKELKYQLVKLETFVWEERDEDAA